MIIQKYNLNLIPDKVPVVVNVSQYDENSRTIVFELYYESVLYPIPSGYTVTVRGEKPDKTGFEYPCTYDGAKVQFVIQEQQTIINGNVPCEIRIANGNEILGTCNFILAVEKAPISDDTKISDTDLPLIEEASRAADRAVAAANMAESVLSTAVKSVNSILPDGSGNVDIVFESIPTGGTTGQVLAKTSNTDYAVGWTDMDAESIPSGGTTGQVLAKSSNTDYDAAWETINQIPSGGTTGQVLSKTSNADYAVSWQDAAANSIPAGGTTGQALVKASNTDYDLTYKTLNQKEVLYEFKNTSGTQGLVNTQLDMTKLNAATHIEILYSSYVNGNGFRSNGKVPMKFFNTTVAVNTTLSENSYDYLRQRIVSISSSGMLTINSCQTVYDDGSSEYTNGYLVVRQVILYYD